MPISSQSLYKTDTVHFYSAEDIEPTFKISHQLIFEDYLPSDTPSTLNGFPKSEESIDSFGNGLCNAKHYQQGDNREKRRLNNINSAFECLKKVIPTFPFEKRLTKIDTLRLAISYIQMLEAILKSEQHPELFIGQLLDGRITSEWYTHELSARLNWLNWENLGMVHMSNNPPAEQ